MAALCLKASLVLSVFLCSCFALDCPRPQKFRCRDGACIKTEEVCDGRAQCPDNSDEDDCESQTCRLPKWHLCADNTTCIAVDFMCDGFENCPMGDDEEHCARPHDHPLCTQFEFTCTDKTCVPLDMICDGRRDCADDSDETVGCLGIEDRCHGFVCKNKHCLESHDWVCDGYDDCGDGSDEVGCVANCNLEDHRFLCKDNSSCISLSKVCDGFQDCHDASDEGGKCNEDGEKCEKFECPEKSECHTFPSGGSCICPKGYIFNSNKKTCEDVDECKKYDVCSQGCINTNGSYSCTCANKFKMERDGRTCTVRGGEPLLFYTTQKSIKGIYLKNRHIYPIATNLSQVIGVDFDGTSVYWTDIKHQSESIVRAREDGSKQEIIVSSGLEAPEDLAIDWLTGNIYFTDNSLKHIAVCTNNGYHCAILIVKNVDQPRGIALNPPHAHMYWTDWGDKPMIGRATMDGLEAKALVSDNIIWPNGIALDIPNNRLYWSDAKFGTIESALLDGTDRRVVLKDILKHPYGIAIFEDRLYWSDWGTKSIHACHKFTGKHHEIITKDKYIYDITVHHSAQQPKILNHGCQNHKCSHICLLSPNNSFSCACPEGMVLGVDHRSCKHFQKKQRLYLGVGNYLVHMDHSTFGRHKINEVHPLPMFINKIVFNTLTGTVFIADNIQRAIYEVHPIDKGMSKIVENNIGNVTALAFDHLANNLYWTDAQRHTVEVLSLQTKIRAIVHHFSGTDIPIALALIPEQGNMFITLHSAQNTHIDIQPLHGRGYHHHIVEESLGKGAMQLFVDSSTQTVFWLDTQGGKIEFSNYEGSFRHLFRTGLKTPVSMSIVDDDVAWSIYGSKTLFYTHKSNLASIKKVDIDVPNNTELPHEIPLVATQPLVLAKHRCLNNNGGCSDICVSLGQYASACLCPVGMVFKDHMNTTCIDEIDCEYKCGSGECLTASRRCNGHKDCADGMDEKDCDASSLERAHKICTFDQFACHDGTQCIDSSNRCDRVVHCKDKSDEEHCDLFDRKTKCHNYQHMCDNGRCIDLTGVCDGVDDCGDSSDELNCEKLNEQKSLACKKDMFKCSIGTCIPKSWECDGTLDCSDGSDEHDRCSSYECPDGSMRCKFGYCIDEKLICDGNDDCGDNSDEKNCNSNAHQFGCDIELDSFGDPIKFQCTSDPNMCLDIRAKCNGTAECPRGEDEFGCNGCSIHEFQCKNSRECIRKEFKCDGDKDCGDGSDEIDCQNHNSSLHHHFATLCRDGMFHCKDGTCIDQLRVCDGLENCDGGEDEGPTCKTACVNHACQQKCTPSPYGAICSCNDGFRLNGDKKSCSDINECVESKPCAQICENEFGTYRCSCYAGFMLRPDKTSCKSIESEHYLLFTSSNQVRKLSENPISLKVLWSLNDTSISGLGVNVHKKRAYYTVAESEDVFEYDLTDGSIRSVVDEGSKRQISVDWITDLVYVIDYSRRYSIKACDFFTKYLCIPLVQFTPRDVVKALAVDAVNKHLFYVVVHFHTFGDPKSVIYKTGLDGIKKDVVTSVSGFLTSLECDPYKKELYFVDLHTRSLQVVSYSGGSPTALIKMENAIKNPSGLTIFENTAFIINTGSAEAVKCQLYGEFQCQAFNLNVYNSENIIAVAASNQRMVDNPCKANNCSLLCVQGELGPRCVCHSGEYVDEGMRCSTTPTSLLKLVKEPTNSAKEPSSSHTALIVCLSLFFLLVAAVVGYFVYRWKTNCGKFNVSMHFQNPISRTDLSQTMNGESNFSKLSKPIHRLFHNGKGCEILMDSKKDDAFQNITSLDGASGKTNEDSGSESADVGNFDDSPRAHLVL